MRLLIGTLMKRREILCRGVVQLVQGRKLLRGRKLDSEDGKLDSNSCYMLDDLSLEQL